MELSIKWNSGDDEPQPSQKGVKADLYLCIDLSDQYQLYIYQYEIHEWTRNGGDKQFIKFWTKLPEIPNKNQILGFK
jgi:hypothetical protein